MPQPWMEQDELAYPQDPMAEYAVLMASYVLWGLSGRKYDGTTRTQQEYLCSSNDLPSNCSWDDRAGGWWNPHVGMVSYVLPAVGGSAAGLGSQFRLRNTPVRRVHAVAIGDQTLANTDYRVANYSTLRLVGDACTRICEGVTVDYTYGVAPPAAGRLAAIELANELILSWNDDGACSLPQRTMSVSRQGITIDMIDPMDFLEKGRTGLLKVDLFLATANPGKALMPAKVFSPDIPRGNRYDRPTAMGPTPTPPSGNLDGGEI